MESIRSARKQDMLRDVSTGIMIAVLSVPLSMGYAQVAGLPPQYGLYGSLVPVLVFALITSSPRVVFGVDAAPAALIGTLLPHLGIAHGSAEAVAVMPVLTFLTAMWLLLFCLLRGGRFAKLVAEPVLGGCVSGIASIVILTQLPLLFGGSAASGRAPALLRHMFQELDRFHPLSFLLGVGTVAAILIGRRKTRASMSTITMVIGIILAMAFRLDRHGVALLGPIPAGLPMPSFGGTPQLAGREGDVMVDTLAIALVIAAETLVSTREIGRKHDDQIDNQRELLAYGLSNLAAAIFGSCPVTGSISRTARAGRLGVRSQWMSVTAFAVMALVLLAATPLLRWLPVPVLTGIVLASLISILEFPMAVHLWKIDRPRCYVFLAAFAAEMLGMAEGVLVGVVLSFASFTMYASMQPREFLGCLEGEPGFFPLSQSAHAMPIKNTLLYQFSGELFFANIDDFVDDLHGAMRPDVRLIVVSGLTSVDLVSAERLLELYHKLRTRGVLFFLAGHNSAVNEQLILYGAEKLIHDGAVKHRYVQALAAGGLTPPYPLDPSDVIPGVGGSGTLEEFSWTYGALAGDRLEKLSAQVTNQLINNPGGEINTEKMSRAERDVIGEFWDGGKDYRALAALAGEAAVRPEAEARFRRRAGELIAHRLQLERQLIYRGDGAVARDLVRLRLHMDGELARQHPEAGKMLAEERERCAAELRETDGEIVDILESLAEDKTTE